MLRSLQAGRGRKVLVALAALAVPVALVLVRVIPASAAPTRVEAESGTCDGTIDSNHLNFSGTGFCNTTNAVGSTLSLPVSVSTAGSYTLTVHFANGTTADRPMDIAVNGTTVSAAHSFPVTANWDTWADSTVTATLNSGSNTILFTSTTSGGGPNIDYVDVNLVSSGATKYEAENGVCQGTIDSNHLNFSGTGFCNTNNATGATETWTITGATGGNTTVTIRYSNGTTANRPMTIAANGTTVGTLTFAPTADWDTWANATIDLPLVTGTNTVVATATTANGGPNLDYLSIPAGVDTLPPTVPQNPRVGPITCDSSNHPVVDFSWDASTDNVGVAFYDVFHDGQLITSVGGNTLTAHIVAVQKVTWGLYVQARDAAGNVSQASATVSITPPQCGDDPTPPTAPTNLTATASGTTITLNWTASTDNVGVTAYEIHRDGTVIATLTGQGGAPPTTYPDAGLAPGSTHSYFVVALDLAGNRSPNSNTASATVSTCTNPVCEVKQLTTDDDIPWGLVTLPDGTIVYNRRDAHDIIHLNPRTGAKTNLGTVPNVQSTNGEGGLLGLEINPASYSTDHWFYIMHTSPSDNRIVRIKYDPTTDKIVTSTEQVLISGILRNQFHDGGRLRFSPDGRFLFATTGDAQNGANAQSKTSLNGKVLRINPDGSIPTDNPFGNAIWSYGHRNPQGLAFDSHGNLWEQEFGNSVMDETNLIQKGGNYGWPICEGTSDGTGSCGQAGLIAPKHTYPVAQGSCSGITIIRDALYVACERGTRLYRLVITSSLTLTNVTQWFNGTYGRLRTVEPAPDGGMWMTNSSGDKDSTAHNSNDVVLHVALN
jgi:glucose/arabinose dehydrogenase